MSERLPCSPAKAGAQTLAPTGPRLSPGNKVLLAFLAILLLLLFASPALAQSAGGQPGAMDRALNTISGDGRRVAMRSPGAIPWSTMACSLPRLRIVTGASTNIEPSSL